VTVTVWSFLIGAALIFVAILGGGLEAKDVKIPVLNIWARILSFVFGIVLIVVGLYPSVLEYHPIAPEDRGNQHATPSPNSAGTQIPQPPSTPPSDQFGVHLITSSTPQIAQENAIQAKSVAPEGSKILLYKRMNSLWATVVIYSDNLAAGADLPKYTKNPDWKGAQVVRLENWCPKAEKLVLVFPSPVGSLSALDCHL
jgi:hypothetical protein